jgi:hypothetical protein
MQGRFPALAGAAAVSMQAPPRNRKPLAWFMQAPPGTETSLPGSCKLPREPQASCPVHASSPGNRKPLAWFMQAPQEPRVEKKDNM